MTITPRDAELILALADNGLVMHKVAKLCYRHPNTVKYHVENIREKTGLDPRDFWDMQKLVPMAQRTLAFQTVKENMEKVIATAKER